MAKPDEAVGLLGRLMPLINFALASAASHGVEVALAVRVGPPLRSGRSALRLEIVTDGKVVETPADE